MAEDKYYIIVASNGMLVGTLKQSDLIVTYKREQATHSKGSLFEVPKETALNLNKKFNFK